MGDDSFFSVWTSTAPGVFIPEHVATGQVKVENLIFGYSIPRSYRPVEVLDSIYRAVEYTQKRLVGVILDSNEKTLKRESLSEEIQETVSESTAKRS